MAQRKPAAEEPQEPEKPTPTRFRNVSPFGHLDVPAIGIIQAGEVFDVSEALGALLAEQPEHYQPAPDAEVGVPSQEGDADGHAA